MTVISDTFADIAGHGDVRAVSFWAPFMRDNATGEFIVTPQYVHVAVAPDGSFTTPDLLPGMVRVRINGIAYDIRLPDWPTPLRLGPLLAEALPVPPAEEATAVRNLGGVAGALFMELDDYTALSAIDPETAYFIPD
ncbi:hypothetical protein IU459_11825 [Nocardia amamiensis]|uniref:Uncharacterized protein n=1 Tax=Nocardia amamiensis TaxID=404578 RepID=A0ABS0CTQ5_9NOCA|nr:hypothetical protein [Nocardia amamiensis]MBF6298229.1 hypothetical protein [Nocardia amamiensis]